MTCVKDCENIQAIHKFTLRLWKYLSFWKKRKNLTLTTPFLQLDLQIVTSSIAKVNSYFEHKLSDNAVVEAKSKALIKAVRQQISEITTMVKFAESMHKDSLQKRHWV